MNLWVRSQDKRILQKVNDIYISTIDNKTIKTSDSEIGVELGTYKTKERAIEVLDEIQDRMLKSAFAKKINGLGEELDLIPNPILIYQMPKD